MQKHGYDCHRTQQYCGNTGDASDVVGLPGIHMECKYRETIGNIYEWIDQAGNDSKKSGNIPAVFCRKACGGTLVVMRIDEWMKLYKAYEKEVTNDSAGNSGC